MSDLEAEMVELAAPPSNQVLDLHGDASRHDLALFLHGNQWMAVEVLLGEFQRLHPEVRSIYYETLPPGILVRQMMQGALRLGELVIRVTPDVLTAGTETLAQLATEGWIGGFYEYARNTLAIVVQHGNPHHIAGWADLLQPGLRVVLPDPETEGVGRLIRSVVRETLGAEAWTELAGRRREQGLTTLTQIHHRETPLLLLAGKADAGPLWRTEALYLQRLKAPLAMVELPEEENRVGGYGVAVVERMSPHPEAAHAFMSFLRGPAGAAILEDYGFEVSAQLVVPGPDHCRIE